MSPRGGRYPSTDVLGRAKRQARPAGPDGPPE